MSGLLGGGTQSATPRRLQAIELQRSSLGEVIPLVWGQARVTPTLVWYGDFTATELDESQGGKGGGGKGGVTGYSYTAAVIMAVCEGPISFVEGVWAYQAYVDLTDINLVLFDGTSGQTPWGHLTANHPYEALSYSDTAYIASTALTLSSGAAMPNVALLVQSPISFGSGIYDALPSAIVTDYLTNAVHGAQFPYLATLTDYQTYTQAMGLFLSPVEATQRPAADFLREILALTNSEAVWSAGSLKIIPRADTAVTGNGATYTPDLTPEYALGDDDYLADSDAEPVRVTRTSRAERYNRVRVEYLDAGHQHNTAIAESSDEADIALHGERVMSTVQAHCITNASTARLVAQLILQRQTRVATQYAFSVRADYSLLEPMDLITITDAALGLQAQLVRILSITDEDDEAISIEVEEVPAGASSAPRYDWSQSQGYIANFAVSPGSVQAPVIFAAPPYLVAPSGGAELWIAVNGAGANWGGCSVWASFDDDDYRMVGLVASPSRYGVTSTSMSAVADPDASSTLRVTLNRSTATLLPATTAAADEMRNLAYVGGEIVSFRDAALISAGVYDLGYFRRGAYGSINGAHSSGAAFVYLDDNIFMLPFDPGQAGQTIYLKFTSFNLYGAAEQSLADVAAYSYTIPAGFAAYVGDAVQMLVNGTCATAGYSVFKPTGANSADSNARSAEAYTDGCAVSFRFSRTDAALAAGLSTDPADYTGHSAPRFAWQCNTSGLFWARHDGVDITATASADPDIVLGIAYDGRTVKYLQDGAQVAAYPVALIDPLYAHCLLTTVGGHIDSLRFSSATSARVVGGNLLSTAPWLIGGAGSQGNYNDWFDSPNTGSTIVLGGGSHPLGPYGQTEVLWRTDGTGTAANGGWINDADLAGVDPSKTYRACVWARWNGVGTPEIYFGCDGGNTYNLAGSANTNPYFVGDDVGALGITTGKWFLLVGMIHGAGYAGSSLAISGIYDPATGQKIYSGTEYRFAPAGIPLQIHRVAQIYTNNSGCVVYFAKPRFEEVNGQEPSIVTLLSPRGVLAYLDAVDTAEIAAGAATDVYVSNVAGPVDVIDTTTPLEYTTLTSITVPSAAYDTDHVVVFTGSVDHHLDSAQASSYARVQGTGSGYPLGAGAHAEIARNPSTSLPDAAGSFAVELLIPTPAGTSRTYDFQALGGVVGLTSSYVDIAAVVAKVIVIKR